MKGKSHKNKSSYKKTRSIILSVVAVLELLLLFMSMTFSWFEGLTSLEMYGNNIKTAAGLNSHITLGETKLDNNGNILEGENFNDIIDLTEFFDTQANVHLSPVSSADGKNFYAPYNGTPTNSNYKTLKYRKLQPEDINANVIRFEFNISSPEGPTDIYLTEILPIVHINGNAQDSSSRYATPFRYSFSDGTDTHILRVDGDTEAGIEHSSTIQESIVSINEDGTIKTISGSVNNKTFGAVERAEEYAYYHDHRTTTTNTPSGPAIKPLFHLEKGERKTISMAVWIEALDIECLKNTDENFGFAPEPGASISFTVKLCTTWSIPREITVYDYTATQWITKEDTVNPATDMVLCVRNAESDSTTKRLYELEYDSSTHSWTGFIPQALDNCELVWVSKSNPNNPHVTWQAPNREGDTELTIFGSSACVWGIGAEASDVTQIFFKDYTSSNWIANDDDLGNDIDLSVNITYDNRILDYKMTDTPVVDNGKNTWSCYIPSTIDLVKFNRSGYNEDNNYVVFNYWNGADRGEETVYLALDNNTGDTGDDLAETILYLSIDPSFADKFYYREVLPTISYTADANKTYVNSVNDKANLDRTKYVPKLDTWPNGDNGLTKVPNKDNLYYIAFDEDQKPANGTTLTIWNRSGFNIFNDVALDMSFGLVTYNSSYDTIYVSGTTEITYGDASSNYYLKCTMNNSGSGVGGNTSSQTEAGYGVWGSLPYPIGSYTTYFVHTQDVEFVNVSYNYDKDNDGTSESYTITLTKEDGKIWSTEYIPDNVTILYFDDSNGNHWYYNTADETAQRTSSTNYYYVTSVKGASANSSGQFAAKANLTGNPVYFKHYNSNATKVTVTFNYKPTGATTNIPFTVDLTKGSDGLTWSTTSIPNSASSIKFTDGTNTWSNSGRSSTAVSYAYAIDKNTIQWKTGTNAANYRRVYFTNNYSWTAIRIYCWYTSGGTNVEEKAWAGTAMTKVATNDQNQAVYAYLLDTKYTSIIFNNNKNGQQTVDITSGISDMKGYYISGGSEGSRTVGTWTVTADFLNTYSS